MTTTNTTNCYLPSVPRVWSRVQNPCSFIIDNNPSEFVSIPHTGEIVPLSLFGEKMSMLNKGNILQYKSNSVELTRTQKYSKIAQGNWSNKKSFWASQNERGYTNPNATGLKRTGNVVHIAIDPITGVNLGLTTAPITCPKLETKTYESLPFNTGIGSINEPEQEIPPPREPSTSGNVFPPITAPAQPIEPIVIQDGGSLICSIQENICTGEIVYKTVSTSQQGVCFPTSDSNVPGPVQYLCWNDRVKPWHTKPRYTMNTSTDKWPTNYKLTTSALIQNK